MSDLFNLILFNGRSLDRPNAPSGRSTSFYPDMQTFDVREEIKELLLGGPLDPGIGRPVILRRLTNEKCFCWKQSGSPDAACVYCQGEGFLFNEDLNISYIARNYGDVQNPSNVIRNENILAAYGMTDENRALAFFLHTAFPNYERYLRPDNPRYDSLYELKVDDRGRPVTPHIRAAKWKMRSVTAHHGDYGRVEYFVAGLEKENL